MCTAVTYQVNVVGKHESRLLEQDVPIGHFYF